MPTLKSDIFFNHLSFNRSFLNNMADREAAAISVRLKNKGVSALALTSFEERTRVLLLKSIEHDPSAFQDEMAELARYAVRSVLSGVRRTEVERVTLSDLNHSASLIYEKAIAVVVEDPWAPNTCEKSPHIVLDLQ